MFALIKSLPNENWLDGKNKYAGWKPKKSIRPTFSLCLRRSFQDKFQRF
jgi:hypothetical protein